MLVPEEEYNSVRAELKELVEEGEVSREEPDKKLLHLQMADASLRA